MKENQENNTISFREWPTHLSRLVALKGTLRNRQRCRSLWFPHITRTVLVVARFHRSPQGNWGAPLPLVPPSFRGQMMSQTTLTINHNRLVESVSPQTGRVSLAELRKTCGRTDTASEGWPCCISRTLCAR